LEFSFACSAGGSPANESRANRPRYNDYGGVFNTFQYKSICAATSRNFSKSTGLTMYEFAPS
jgi:hypothetical protein